MAYSPMGPLKCAVCGKDIDMDKSVYYKGKYYCIKHGFPRVRNAYDRGNYEMEVKRTAAYLLYILAIAGLLTPFFYFIIDTHSVKINIISDMIVYLFMPIIAAISDYAVAVSAKRGKVSGGQLVGAGVAGFFTNGMGLSYILAAIYLIYLFMHLSEIREKEYNLMDILFNRNTAPFTFVSAAMVLVILGSITVPGYYSHVDIDSDIYLLSDATQTSKIKVTFLLTNNGMGQSSDIRVEIFIEDSNGMVHSNTEKMLPPLGPSASNFVEIMVDKPNNTSGHMYFHLMILDGGKKVIETTRYFTLQSNYNQVISYDTEKEEVRGMHFTPGYDYTLMVAATVGAIIIVASGRKKRLPGA